MLKRLFISFNVVTNLTLQKKTRTKSGSGFLEYYPTNAVQVYLPFPSGKRWMTVGTDLTSNQGMSFSAATKPPDIVNYRFGDVT